MIDRQSGTILIECDACPEVFDIDSDDFNETWSAAKRDGWRAKQVGNDWVHLCDGCREVQMK